MSAPYVPPISNQTSPTQILQNCKVTGEGDCFHPVQGAVPHIPYSPIVNHVAHLASTGSSLGLLPEIGLTLLALGLFILAVNLIRRRFE